MANILQIRRRVGGIHASPATGVEGELAAWIQGTNASDPIALYIHDGTGFRAIFDQTSMAQVPLLAPLVGRTEQVLTADAAGAMAWKAKGGVTTQNVVLAPGVDIGAAWTASGAAVTGDVVIASYGGAAYILTNPATPGTAASWTSLGSATSFASSAEVKTGTDATKALNPLLLRGELMRLTGLAVGKFANPIAADASTGNTDAGKIVKLNSVGRIDASMLSITGVKFKGGVDPTAAIPGGTFNSGDWYFANKAGAVDVSWAAPAAGVAVKSGDSLIYDGTAWHAIPSDVSLNEYLPLAGGTMVGNAAVTFNPNVLTTVLDGTDPAKSKIEHFTVDGGVF